MTNLSFLLIAKSPAMVRKGEVCILSSLIRPLIPSKSSTWKYAVGIGQQVFGPAIDLVYLGEYINYEGIPGEGGENRVDSKSLWPKRGDKLAEFDWRENGLLSALDVVCSVRIK